MPGGGGVAHLAAYWSEDHSIICFFLPAASSSSRQAMLPALPMWILPAPSFLPPSAALPAEPWLGSLPDPCSSGRSISSSF